MLKPNFIYGTAWKAEKTTSLVDLALKSGFRAIDTANQAKHYSEALVGQAIKQNIAEGLIQRSDLWLQSKFTSIDGQDHRLPYAKDANLAEQVKQSFASSLINLETKYLDSYLLHGPINYPLLGEEDFQIWQAIEELYKEGKVKAIGVSNFNAKQLEMLIKQAKIKPHFLQNRCFAKVAFDKEIRLLCNKHDIAYQGFSLLTANIELFHLTEIQQIAKKHQLNMAQIIFAFALQIGIIPLTGTSKQIHMQDDLKSLSIKLSNEEIDYIENCII